MLLSGIPEDLVKFLNLNESTLVNMRPGLLEELIQEWQEDGHDSVIKVHQLAYGIERR